MPSLQELISAAPFSLSTDQAHLISPKEFPRKYVNEKGGTEIIRSYFNGSVVRFADKLYFSCRADSKPWFKRIRLVFCELDDNFQPKKGTADWLAVGSNLTNKGPNGAFRVEDIRLYSCGDHLRAIYGDGYEVYDCEFDQDLKVKKWKNITTLRIPRQGSDGREKNWAPFEYKGFPHFVYSDNPRVIWSPLRREAFFSNQQVRWDYGEIRGGSPAVLWPDNKSYLTFFHSALNVSKSSSEEAYLEGRLYYMGAYLFESKPPFRVTHITKVPIMRGEHPELNPIQTNRLAVLFPAGLIIGRDSVWVSLGVNDAETRILRVSNWLLTRLLEPISVPEGNPRLQRPQ